MLTTKNAFQIWQYHLKIKKDIQELHNKYYVGQSFDDFDDMVTNAKNISIGEPLKFIIMFQRHINTLMTLTNKPKINISVKNINYFLSGFMVKFYPDDTNCVDENILEKANNMITTYLKLLTVKGIKPLSLWCQFVSSYNNFVEVYQHWESAEINTQIEELAQHFWSSVGSLSMEITYTEQQLNELIQQKETGKTEYEGRNIDELIENIENNLTNWKEQYQKGYYELKNKVSEMVKKLNGNDGIKYFESLVPVFIDPSFTNEIKETVYKAFWDSVESDLTEEKYDKLVGLLREIKKYLMSCVPNRPDIHHEINSNINIELWRQMLEHNVYDYNDVVGLINYIYSKIIDWCPAVEKENNIKICDQILTDFERVYNGDITMARFCCIFLKDCLQKLEDIILKSDEYKKSSEFHIIKDNIQS
jgi:hypothetical protein